MSEALASAVELNDEAPAETLSERRLRRREQLVEAIAALIRAQGPGVSMDQVAAACGVTKPIIYRHFGDRDGMVRAVSAHYAGTMAKLATEVEVEPEPSSAMTVMRRQIDTYLRLIEQDTNLYRFLSDNKPNDPERQHLLTAVADRVAVLVADYLEGVGRSTTPARTIAYALTGMVHNVGQWWLTDRTLSRDELVDQLVTIAWSGLGPGPTRTQPDEPAHRAVSAVPLDAPDRTET
jgi:AcrR family transcriptional regulator